MSDTAIPATETAEESHGLPHHIKVGRARAGVLLLIVSDILMVASIMAAGGYLAALNTAGAFKADGDQPLFPPSLVVAIALAVSALCFFLWERGVRKGSGQSAFFWLAVVLMLAAVVVEFWVWTSLGYTTDPTAAPAYDAFRSLVILVNGFASFHLILAAIIGILLSGRVMSGRLAGQEYIVQASGYWWYYTAISGVLVWLFIVLL